MASSTAALAARMVVMATMSDAAVGVEAMEQTDSYRTKRQGRTEGEEEVIATAGHAQLLVSSQRHDMPSAIICAATQ